MEGLAAAIGYMVLIFGGFWLFITIGDAVWDKYGGWAALIFIIIVSIIFG